MKNRKKPDQLVQSLDRALDIIERLVNADRPLGVTELSNSLGLHKNTVYRLLATLQYRGYVEKAQRDNKYKIGLKLLEIGSLVLNNIDLRQRIKPFLEELVAKTGETVHLGILDGKEVVYIDKEESPETIRMYSRIGRRAPLYCTSLGKALLAFSGQETIESILGEIEFRKHTANTITDKEKFRRQLKEIREQGFAVDNEEHEDNIRCIAGPVFDYKGNLKAAFSISGPDTRMTEEKTDRLQEVVINYSRKISSSFGYQPTTAGVK